MAVKLYPEQIGASWNLKKVGVLEYNKGKHSTSERRDQFGERLLGLCTVQNVRIDLLSGQHMQHTCLMSIATSHGSGKAQ